MKGEPMIELKSDRLIASFPGLPEQPRLTIDFQRTLRIPDDGRHYPLPPGLGRFPLRHIDDFAKRVPARWLEQGGVLLPMWQAEALWLNFGSQFIDVRGASYPFAIKVATGKVSAITGEPWCAGLSRNPQDYLVVPDQPWLDGYCVEKGVIRQFVAMPLGDGYSAEEQLTGRSECGGIQIEIMPMRAEVFERRFPIVQRRAVTLHERDCEMHFCMESAGMGLAPGGRMRQEIYEDPYGIHDWDNEHSSRCFIHLVNSSMWRGITGAPPPTRPPTAKAYTKAGYPWFDYYDAEAQALTGSKILAALKSVREKGDESRRQPLPENDPVLITNIRKLRAELEPNQVREAGF